ncbi:MAG: GAF domain-containing SpoIIE family protein phosphatase [bacterium]
MKRKNNREDSAVLVTQLEHFNKKLQFLHQISQQISEKKPISQLLHEIMESSKLLIKAEASSLLLFDEQDKKLHFYVTTGEKGGLLGKFSMELGEGIAGWVAEKRKPLVIDDCYKDVRFNPEYDKKSKFKTKSMICVPLLRKDRLLGVIEVINKQGKDRFDSEDLFLFETLASQCAIAIENHFLTEKQIEIEALERELQIARSIQQNLLPASIPSFDDLDVAPLFIPARQIGGDYYNIIRINKDQSLFFVADVSGKSVSAALIVSVVDACLHSYLSMNKKSFDLKELVKTMNLILIETTTPTKFATSWFGLYHHPTAELHSVNAGHNPPYLFSSSQNEIQPLHAGGIFLGGVEGEYQLEILKLHKDDILVYYTDGITEAWNLKEEDYGEERLQQTVKKYKHLPAHEILTAIKQDIRCHVGKAQQSDDIACVVLKKLKD